jgi:predicted O-methyltransferase YrrM
MAIPEVSHPTAECPEPKLWSCFDGMSAELEVLDFMYQLVRTIKPRLVVETGSFRGLAACYIAKGLRENGRGKLVTCEIDPKLHSATKELLGKAKLTEWCDCRLESSLEMANLPGEPIDLLFSDSLPEIRIQEIYRFWDKLDTRSLVVVHDVNSGCHKPLRDQIIQQDTDGKLSVVMLPTPRGLAICQKREGRA